MSKIVVASSNPVKIRAALMGFETMFPDQSFSVEGEALPSGISDQPMGDDETLLGALNRAQAAQVHMPDADFWVGIEGGCAEDSRGMTCFAWVVVLSRDRRGQARTGAFYLPDEVAVLVRGGMELGHADDIVFGRANSKQADGSVGLLTGGVIDRTAYYAHAVILALVPFKNPGFVFPH